MGFSKRLSWEVIGRMVADAVMVNVALIIAFALRFFALVWINAPSDSVSSSMLFHILHGSVKSYMTTAVLLTPISLSIFYLSGFYSHGRAYRSRYKVLLIFQAVVTAYLFLGLAAYLLFKVTFWLPRTVWLAGLLLTFLLVTASRFWSALWRRAVWAEAKILGKPAIRAIRNVTVIGGAGYVGSVLVRKLLERGYRVTVLDAFLYGDESIRDLRSDVNFQCLTGDIRDVEAVVRALQYADAVVHLGGLVGDPACTVDEQYTLETNLVATRMIAETSRAFGVERFIFASTCSVYGASNEILNERSRLNPVSIYARSKIGSERVLLNLKDNAFAPTILRFATIYGISPRPRFDLVVNLLAAKAVCEKSITTFGGDQWRPFVHVQDVADAIVKCLEGRVHAVRGETFNVGSDDQNYTICQLADLIRDLIPGSEVIHKPQDTDLRNYRVSFAKIRRHLGYVPRHTVAEGVLEIKAAVESGRIRNYLDARYSNFETLSNGTPAHSSRNARISPLCRSALLEEAEWFLQTGSG